MDNIGALFLCFLKKKHFDTQNQRKYIPLNFFGKNLGFSTSIILIHFCVFKFFLSTFCENRKISKFFSEEIDKIYQNFAIPPFSYDG